MAIRKEKLKELVKEEAKKLRKHATREELYKLNFGNLVPSSQFSCIYGQLTGNCFSNRATDLIEECCDRVYERSSEITDSAMNSAILGKSPKRLQRYLYFSPIEIFIHRPENKTTNNAHLIAYLKGETRKLNFE